MYRHRKRPSPALSLGSQTPSERSSGDSSDSGVSLANQAMARLDNERSSRPGYRGNKRENNLANSSSSGSSARHHKFRSPITAPRLSPVASQNAAQAQTKHALNSRKQQPSIMNASHTTETHTTVSEVVTYSIPPSLEIRQHQRPMRAVSLPRPVTKNQEVDWAYQQEEKIKLLRIPKVFWTQDIYGALSRYGTVVRIEIERSTHNHNAFVTFRPPPQNRFPQRPLPIGEAFVRWTPMNPFVALVTSPVDPAKRYPELNILTATSIDFGIEDADRSMIKMHTIMQRSGIQAILNLNQKEINIRFPLQIGQQTYKYQFKLPIPLLSKIYKVSDSKTCQVALIIPFNSPPQFFVQKIEGEKMEDGRVPNNFSPDENVWSEWGTWFRETDIVEFPIKEELKNKPLMHHKGAAIIDIGRWTTYRLSFNEATFSGNKYTDFSKALADFGVGIQEIDEYKVKDRIVPPIWLALQEEIAGTHPNLEPNSKEPKFDDLFSQQIHLAFPVRYQLEVCLSNGYLKEHTINSEFLTRLASLESCLAVSILEQVAESTNAYFDPMKIFELQARGDLNRTLPTYCILQRSAIITPTMTIVAPAAMETSNRILRAHVADADRFIRIRFSDEKTEGSLWNMPNGRADALFDRVLRALKNGIVVAGRYYEFLAFGNSQFREHGAFFYAPTSSKSADDIRVSLGQFHHIKSVPKFGARLGQCFSTTRAMRVNVKIVMIPDVERNGYNFTDGVGKLSLFLASMAAQELGLSNAFGDPPSLYQFRLGGCKGVLAVDPKIAGAEVHIRPSQHKFEAKFNGLEIIRSSALATPFFNRQIIIVLSNLGVKDHVFVRKQQEMVNDYERAMTDERVALRKLSKNIDMNKTTITMAGMVLDGFMNTKEPFLMSLLGLWRASTIKNLKEKARIAIEDGAFVLGCVDETSTLRGYTYDSHSRPDATREEKLANLPEIFLQIDDPDKKGRYKVIEGICILARNPSLHPGDLRVVRAVDAPVLHHLKNVVVVPSTGDRDLANMCSGGDLDGDDYMVLWDSEILPEIINVAPMDFTPERLPLTEEPITVADMGQFLVQYMKNNSLGQIAHAHLAQADWHAEGVFSETCIELARLHSQAVDYPKSGVPAVMNRSLQPRRWPHFMEKKHKPGNKTYHSKKILGQLYDQVQLVDFKPQWENAFDERVLNAFELNDDILRKAADIKASYDRSLKRLMGKHGIRTEFEAWSVFVLEHNHESNNYKFAEEFGRTIDNLKKHFNDICRTAAGGNEKLNWSCLGPFVAAMYTVTAQELITALAEYRTKQAADSQEQPVREPNPEEMPLISFPWLFPNELGKIATEASAICRLKPVEAPRHDDVSRHYRKTKTRPYDDTPIDSTVETEIGITRFGELLNLGFDPVQPEAKSTQN